VDRLGAGWLGPYGNTWLDTPNFNRLAARSLLCETVIADTPDLAGSYRAYWTGRHAMEPDNGGERALAELVSAAGVTTVLVSDEQRVAEHPLARGFGERRLVPEASAARSAEAIEQTGLFSLFDVARNAILDQTQPFLLWIHARGMSGLWDAPLELRYQIADAEDPEPPSFVEPPNVLLRKGFDPDELLGYVHAYAGQVALADMCLGMLLDCVDEHPLKDETLLVVTSPRGYPLGEHRRVGPCDDALHGELLHVPLLVQIPDQAPALMRFGQVIQPTEVNSSVVQACGWQRADESPTRAILNELNGESPRGGNAGCSVGLGQKAIRTPAWFLREFSTGEGSQRELFAKPDDRWEANEVSSRCSDIVELLAGELDRFEQAARERRLSESPPLAELLCDVWR
jgi:hypothetical protein